MQKLIECVPNFSEGRDLEVIRQITEAIASVEGVSLLDVDPGATHQSHGGHIRRRIRRRRWKALSAEFKKRPS